MSENEDDKPWKCAACGAGFDDPDQLIAHIKEVHDPNKK